MEEHRTDLPKPKSISGKRNTPQPLSYQIHLHLTTLFPPKQKELVLKKLRRDPFTKLEREYYSRVVKKNKSLSQQRDQGNSDYTHKQKSLTFGDSLQSGTQKTGECRTAGSFIIDKNIKP
ncbi:MAG: hypothetical protein IMF11_04635 [Proteobacteria bacterium]|nr:hypothetical protein [Pseudomonadota bacterium]